MPNYKNMSTASEAVAGSLSSRIRGVTFSDHPSIKNFRKLQQLGVDTIRTWGVNEETPALLDLEQQFKIKVLLGLWLRHGRPGAEGDDDFNWIDDEAGKQAQFDATLKHVRAFRSHPALWAWGLGNEVTLNVGSEEEKIAYATFLEALCRAVKDCDPQHPTASVSAWTLDVPYWQAHCPSLDLYGINVYGYAIYDLPWALRDLGVEKPYFLGEFGVTGEWSVPKDQHGVAVEPSDQEKYEMFATTLEDASRIAGPSFLGAFLFNFEDKLDFAAIWLNLMVDGKTRPSFWGARQAYSAQEPDVKLPTIASFAVEGEVACATPSQWITLNVIVASSEPGLVQTSFHFNQRAGSRVERDAVLQLLHRPSLEPGTYDVQLPQRTGATKLYVFAVDRWNNLAIASTSIMIVPATLQEN